MFFKVLARRRSPTLHCYIHRRTHSRKAPLSDKLQETAAEPLPLCRQPGKNQQKAQQQSSFPELSVAPISCQQQQTPTDGQAEDCLHSLGKDAPVPLRKAEFPSVKVSVSTPSRLRKGESRSQGDVKENSESHSVYVTDSSINAKLPASKADVNTFELVECKHHAAKVESSSQDPKDHGYRVTGYEAKVSTTEWRGKLPNSDRAVLSGFNASETGAFAKGNDASVLTSISISPSKSGDPFAPLRPLEDASHNELLRKAKLVEGLSPTEVASLLKKRAFRSCSFEQLETMLQFLEEYHASSERSLKVLVMNPGVLSHSVDLLQQKFQVFVDFQIEKETIDKLCTKVNILATSVGSLQAKLAFLGEVGLDVEAKNKIFYRAPCAIALSLKGLKKTRAYLSGMGVDKERFVRLVCSCPQLLWVSCDSNLIPRYHFFQQFGIPAVHLPRLVCFSSRSSVDTIRARMQALEELGFSHKDVCLMKFDMAEIVKFPRSLLSSLECRIIPRCRLAEEHGLFKRYSLASILSYSEARFRKLLREPSDTV